MEDNRACIGTKLVAGDNVDLTANKEGDLVVNATGGSGEGIDYSFEEQGTGRRWVGGKKIYQKTIDCGALPNAATKTVGDGINRLQFIRCFFGGTIYPGGPEYAPVVYADPLAVTNAVSVAADDSNVVIKTGYNRAGWSETDITPQHTCTDRQLQQSCRCNAPGRKRLQGGQAYIL